MQKLFDISYYNNFGAGGFNHIPGQRFVRRAADRSLLASLPDAPFGNDVHYWLFGFAFTGMANLPVTTFDVGRAGDGESVQHCRLVPDAWYAVDDLVEQADGKTIVAVIDVGYLGSLFDPRPILAALKRLLVRQPVTCHFLWRDGQAGAVRRWTRTEFAAFLQGSGFELVQTLEMPEGETLFHAHLSVEYYCRYLEELGLSSHLLKADFLLITTEDASLQRTGGIGTYVANVKRLNPLCVVLFAATGAEIGEVGNKTVIAERILGHPSHEQMFEGDGLLEAVRLILYTLPCLKVCEFQDYLSIGFRLVQAKKVGGLPASLGLRVFLHGNLDYVKYGIGTRDVAVYGSDDVRSAVKDRFIFGQVDQVKAPSRYLLELMCQEYGYALHNPVVQRLPFDLDQVGEMPTHFACKRPKKLAYIGKFSPLKGWPDFLQALERLRGSPCLREISQLIMLCPGNLATEDRARIEAVLPCTHHHLSHAEMIRFLVDNRDDTLFVVPSGSESYSFVFLELILTGCRVVGYRRGGALEVVSDDAYIDQFFAAPNPVDLAGRIEAVLNEDPAAHVSIVAQATQNVWARQRQINRMFQTTDPIETGKRPNWPSDWLDDVSVSTPVYNTPISFLQELAASLRASSIAVREWILVNDGSAPDYARDLQVFVDTCADLNTRLVHQSNKGLAGARNRGLAESSTRLTYFMDSDDLFLPHTLAHAALAMAIQPDPLLAVSGFPVYFRSVETLPSTVQPYRSGEYWKPLGIAEARTLAIRQNEFIPASTMMNTGMARKAGGWDESDRATWEDWAFYLKAAWSGHAFLLMPWPGYLYRNTPGSMSKTYNQFFGVRRLVRNFPLLDRFEANALIGLIQSRRDHSPSLDSEAAHLRKELDAIYRSNSWKLTRPLRSIRRIWSEVRLRLNAFMLKR